MKKKKKNRSIFELSGLPLRVSRVKFGGFRE